PLRAQQPRAQAQLLPGPQLSPPRTDRAPRGLRRPGLQRGSETDPANPQGTPAADPSEKEGTARTPAAASVAPGRRVLSPQGTHRPLRSLKRPRGQSPLRRHPPEKRLLDDG